MILAGILSGSKSYGAETLTVVRADPDTDTGDPMEVMTRFNRDPSGSRPLDLHKKLRKDGVDPPALQLRPGFKIGWLRDGWKLGGQ